MKMQVTLVTGLAFLLLFFQNCSKFEMNASTQDLSALGLSSSVPTAKNVLSLKCASCHSSTQFSSLSNILSDSFLVSQNYIVPGDPAASLLWQRIANGSMPPQGSPALTSEESLVIHDWILTYTSPIATTPSPSPNPSPSPSPSPNPSTTATFTQIKNQILTPSCINCHQNYASYSSVILDVVPNNPTQSNFYLKINSGQMPKNAAKLSQANIDLVYSWIQNGAPNN